MMLVTYSPQRSSPQDFVVFWARQYNYKLEHLYTNNIGQALTAERVHQLFKWKNGSRLSDRKQRSVDNNFVAHIPKLTGISPETDAHVFLNEFPNGGAIWRIFWLHCWQPNRFPIYDQHVHRAMAFIEHQRIEELPAQDEEKVQLYLKRYLAFHQNFAGEQRSVDKALWVYGKFVKATQFPVL